MPDSQDLPTSTSQPCLLASHLAMTLKEEIILQFVQIRAPLHPNLSLQIRSLTHFPVNTLGILEGNIHAFQSLLLSLQNDRLFFAFLS